MLVESKFSVQLRPKLNNIGNILSPLCNIISFTFYRQHLTASISIENIVNLISFKFHLTTLIYFRDTLVENIPYCDKLHSFSFFIFSLSFRLSLISGHRYNHVHGLVINVQ